MCSLFKGLSVLLVHWKDYRYTFIPVIIQNFKESTLHLHGRLEQ